MCARAGKKENTDSRVSSETRVSGALPASHAGRSRGYKTGQFIAGFPGPWITATVGQIMLCNRASLCC